MRFQKFEHNFLSVNSITKLMSKNPFFFIALWPYDLSPIRPYGRKVIGPWPFASNQLQWPCDYSHSRPYGLIRNQKINC